MQKLEESLLNPDSSAEEKTYTVRGDEDESNTTPVPARIREIITRNLADVPTGTHWWQVCWGISVLLKLMYIQ